MSERKIVIELTEEDAAWLGDLLASKNGLIPVRIEDKIEAALECKHQRVVVEIIPIAEMPEEWKDYRTVPVFCGRIWKWVMARWRKGYGWQSVGGAHNYKPTHVVDMLPDAERIAFALKLGHAEEDLAP